MYAFRTLYCEFEEFYCSDMGDLNKVCKPTLHKNPNFINSAANQNTQVIHNTPEKAEIPQSDASDPYFGMSTYIINNNLHGGSMVSWVGLSYLCDMLLTVVECTWAFDMIMLGATVLGAGLILFTGPIGAALIVSAIGVGLIAAGGFYLKNIGDRFSDATLLMDNYMNGDDSAGEKLKYHSLFHGATVGIFAGVSKYFSKETTAPFFKLWAESELGYSVSRAFGNTSIGVDGAFEILTRINSKQGAMLKGIVEQSGTGKIESYYKNCNPDKIIEYIEDPNVIPDLGAKTLKHPLADHMIYSYANQINVREKNTGGMSTSLKSEIEHYLSFKSFFKKSWTRNQTVDAINYCYKQMVANNIRNGEYEISYLGEKVTIVLEDGYLKTAYGKYRYTYKKFIKICDEMKASDFDSSLYLR